MIVAISLLLWLVAGALALLWDTITWIIHDDKPLNKTLCLLGGFISLTVVMIKAFIKY